MLNRKLIKTQARQLIKDRVFALFVICAIVIFLSNGINAAFGFDSDVFNLPSISDHSSGNNFDYFNNFDNFDDEFGSGLTDDDSADDITDNPIENFGGATQQSRTLPSINNPIKHIRATVGRFSGLISLVMSPLIVTLFGYFVCFVKRESFDNFSLGDDIGKIFKDTFDSSYGRKLLLYFLRYLFMVLLCLCFVIPGIVYYYKTYFAFQLMVEFPKLKPMEALKLSKKMVNGHKGELFTLDLSFFWWYCLCGITLGIAGIYVAPYVMTTQALYYENFKIRGKLTGELTDDDFLSEEEKAQRYYQNPYGYNQQPYGYQPFYTQQNYNNQQQYPPQQNGYYYQQQPVYQQPAQPVAPQQQPVAQPAQNDYYYRPPVVEQAPQAPQPAEDASDMEIVDSIVITNTDEEIKQQSDIIIDDNNDTTPLA